MRLKRFVGILAAVLVGFSCSFLPVSRVYADDSAFNLFWNIPLVGFDDGQVQLPVPIPQNGYTCLIPYETTWLNYSTSATYYGLSCRSNVFDTSKVGGKSFYIQWFIRYSSGTINVNPTVAERYMDWEYTTATNGTMTNAVDIPSIAHIGTAVTTFYHDAGYSETVTMIDRFTIPENATAIRGTQGAAYRVTGTGDASLKYLVFPVCYLAGWGSEVSEQLDDILTELTAQGVDIQSILSVLNDIYTRLQTINTSITTQTSVLRSVLTYIQGDLSDRISNIESAVDNVGLTVDDIYVLLRNVLEAEHLENDNVDQSTEQAIEQVMMREDAEQYWNDANTNNFNAIGLQNFTFSSGVLNGLGVVGTVFTSLWNALGGWTVVIVFPLTLGIALVVIGRIPRSGGNGKSKKGDE